jgi:hypothetical protein
MKGSQQFQGALYQGTTSQAAEKLIAITFAGRAGLQASV